MAVPFGYFHLPHWPVQEDARPVEDTRTCKGCGETFVLEGPSDDRIYCSYLCMQNPAPLPEWPAPAERVRCAGCGRGFWRGFDGRSQRRLFCSGTCRVNHTSRGRRAILSAHDYLKRDA